MATAPTSLNLTMPLVKLLEDCDDLRHQLFVHNQLATLRLAVETDVVDANPPQLLRSHRATRTPARAEFGGSDGINGRRVGRCGRRRAARWQAAKPREGVAARPQEAVAPRCTARARH